MEIDAANNNTSVVVEIEWRGLAAAVAAATRRSRRGSGCTSRARCGRCTWSRWPTTAATTARSRSTSTTLLPPVSPDGRPRHAVVSTHDGSWDSVPDTDTLATYASRVTLHDTRDVPRGTAVEIVLPG